MMENILTYCKIHLHIVRGDVMLEIRHEFITGVSLGFEWIDKEEIDEFERGWVFMMDFLIFRVLVDKTDFI